MFYSFDITRNHTDPCHFLHGSWPHLDAPRFAEHAEHVVEHFFEKVEDKATQTRWPSLLCRADMGRDICSANLRDFLRDYHMFVYVMLFPAFQRFQLVSRIDMNKFVDDISTGLKHRVILLHCSRSSYNDHNFACFDSYL